MKQLYKQQTANIKNRKTLQHVSGDCL